MIAIASRLALLTCCVLAGCGGPRYGPNSLEPADGYATARTDPRPLVARITAVETHTTPGGMIVRAFGDPGRLGYWNPDLVDVTPDDSDVDTVTLEFRVAPPIDTTPSGTPASRTLDAAAFISEADMRGKRRIQIVGATGSRALQR